MRNKIEKLTSPKASERTHDGANTSSGGEWVHVFDAACSGLGLLGVTERPAVGLGETRPVGFVGGAVNAVEGGRALLVAGTADGLDIKGPQVVAVVPITSGRAAVLAVVSRCLEQFAVVDGLGNFCRCGPSVDAVQLFARKTHAGVSLPSARSGGVAARADEVTHLGLLLLCVDVLKGEVYVLRLGKLDEALGGVNRYRHALLIVGDVALCAFEMGGKFGLRDAQTFANVFEIAHGTHNSATGF